MLIRMVGRLSVTAAALISSASCNSATDATAEVGQLRTAIVAGAVQTTIAGAPRLPNSVIGQAQRVPLGSAILGTSTMANATATVTHLPNVVMCVGEDQLDLIPFSRCVNTDTAGKATFTFSPTTKAGTYRAKINFTLGLEESTVDSVLVTVSPDAVDPTYRTTPALQYSPAVCPTTCVLDKYGNGVPFKVVGDGRLAVGDTTVGSIGARTVTFADSLISNQQFTLELRGASDVLVGRMRYQIGAGSTGKAQLFWTAAGLNLSP